MSKFKANSALKEALSKKQVINTVESSAIPEPDTVNRQGFEAYSLSDEVRLVSMLNTLKLEPQYYRSESETMKELKKLIDRIASHDPYFVAQAIVWSRCKGEGMRSINHLAAALLAPYLAGTEWGKRFYSLWNKKEQKGGCIFRADDMSEILYAFSAINDVKATNAMKKGFASALENMDSQSILKYKKALFDIINLSHPNSSASKAEVEVDGKIFKTLDAIKQGLSVSATTWETAQSEAGQMVAEALKSGQLTQEEADKLLEETKASNWNQLLEEHKLGILAAIRNIRNILSTKANTAALCELLSDPVKLRQGKIMPYQIDIAMTVTESEFGDSESRKVLKALKDGFVHAIPNLKEALPGKTLVMVDMSGSMCAGINYGRKSYQGTSWSEEPVNSPYSCAYKANLIAAAIALGTDADIIRFGSRAEYYNYNPNTDVFQMAKAMWKNMGGTDLRSAWQLAKQTGIKYDRVIILSDNECNIGSAATAYKSYVDYVGNPYIYSVDLAAYGTTPLAGERVHYYSGYGWTMFDDIAKTEFKAAGHLDEIRAIEI